MRAVPAFILILLIAVSVVKSIWVRRCRSRIFGESTMLPCSLTSRSFLSMITSALFLATASSVHVFLLV